MAKSFGAAGLPAGDVHGEVVDLFADGFEVAGAFEDRASVHIHVLAHAMVGLLIAADFDDWGDRGADD